MYEVKVTGHFDAAHQLPGVEICEHLHGHTWKIEVGAHRLSLNDKEMVIDFRIIKDAFRKYDHTFLNDFFQMPTAETLAKKIYSDIENKDANVVMDYVRVYESEDCYAEYH